MTSDSRKNTTLIEETIESLCSLGCNHVNQLIADAKKGNEIDELSNFKATEISQIIDELSKIMAVYDDDKNSTS